jgi:sugar phosphate isomerase/epimerase
MAGATADHGKLIGMSLIAGRDDIETATATVSSLGFEAIEIHASQIGPGLPGVPVFEAHAAAAGDVIRRAGMTVSTLNVVGDATFDPFGGPEALAATVDGLAAHLRWAAAMGAPRVLIWEGRVTRRQDVAAACKTLAEAIAAAAERSRLADPPVVSCELHPFTFALQHRALPELATALRPVGAGICLDYCHCAVALGRDFIATFDDEVMAAVNHVHYCDSDALTSELHFPPGDGVLDLDAIGARLAGRPLALSWDLFGWPGVRHAVRSCFDTYATFVRGHAAGVRP